MVYGVMLSCAIGCVSAYYLYGDHRNRKFFSEYFDSNSNIGNKQLITGIISSDNSDKHPRMFATFPFLQCPFIFPKETMLSIYERNCIVAYHADNKIKRKFTVYHYNQAPNKTKFDHFPKQDVTMEYWQPQPITKYLSPNIKFNGLKLFLKKSLNKNGPTTNINYVKNITTIISSNKMLIEKFIPNNSEITIFGEKIDNHYVADFIGPKNKVLDYVACEYYGIRNINTIICAGILFISSFYILNKLAN